MLKGNCLFGALTTFGGHKGYGMAVACELLGGALSGGNTWRGISDGRAAVLCSWLTILIDQYKLGTRESFEHEAAEFITWLKQSPAPQGSATGGVLIAGEPERAARVEREKDGFVVGDNTCAAIVQAGAKVGCTVARLTASGVATVQTPPALACAS